MWIELRNFQNCLVPGARPPGQACIREGAARRSGPWPVRLAGLQRVLWSHHPGCRGRDLKMCFKTGSIHKRAGACFSTASLRVIIQRIVLKIVFLFF